MKYKTFFSPGKTRYSEQTRRGLWLMGAILCSMITSLCSTALFAEPMEPTILDSSKIIKKGICTLPKEDEFVVLFIPGILGSRLEGIHGEAVWAKNMVPEVTDLALLPNSVPLRATILDGYPIGVTRLDFYGHFESRVRDALSGRVQLIEYAYDWRQDILKTAEDLDKVIRNDWRGKLRGRQLVIVAHSMGGLVAWIWKNKFYRDHQEDYDFTWNRLILLGSPLRGSCETLNLLLRGYQSIPEAGAVEKVSEILFDDLRPAAFTFPSVFQLLPAIEEGAEKACLTIENEDGEVGMDHFSISTWSQLISLLDKKPILWIFSGKSAVWERLDMSYDKFMSQLDVMLGKGRDFRENFDLSEAPLEGKITYFYSGQYYTTRQVVVEKERDRVKDLRNRTVRMGDGRVLNTSATIVSARSSVARRLRSSHHALVKDTSFTGYMRDYIVHEGVRLDCSRVAEDEQLAQRFASLGAILPLSEFKADAWNPQNLEASDKAILTLNLMAMNRILQSDEMRPFQAESVGVAIYQYARHLDDEVGRRGDALPFYEIALATGDLQGTANYAYALNRYGYGLIEEGDYGNALAPLDVAVEVVRQNSERYDPTFRGRLFNNYGMALESTHNLSAAHEAFEVGVSLGSAKAQSNLERVSAKLGQALY